MDFFSPENIYNSTRESKNLVGRETDRQYTTLGYSRVIKSRTLTTFIIVNTITLMHTEKYKFRYKVKVVS